MLDLSAITYDSRSGRQCQPSALHLPRRLIDQYLHGHAFGPAAAARTTHRGSTQIIEADRHTHMRVGRADAVRRVERNPADARNVGLGPGMAGVLLHDAIGTMEVPADIAGRNIQMTRRRDEDVGEVLAHTALECEGLRGRRG